MKRFLLLAVLFLTACYHEPVRPPMPPIPPGLPEAPASFDLQSNGFTTPAQHALDQAQFEEDVALPELGPVYNARACADCHDNPVTGGNSQVSEHRVSPEPGATLYMAMRIQTVASATLIHDRATDVSLQQTAPLDAVNALRMSVSTMGDGFVEAVPDDELQQIAAANGGQFVMVPVLESLSGATRVGRFGWKDQHASLLSFAGDADFNEKGVGNRLVPDPTNGIEDQQSGSTTGCSDPSCEDIDFYASFMRATKAPPRGPITPAAIAGRDTFYHIGCASCHVETLYTDRLVFHPFGDFLLHDIGTGDGIQQGLAPANKVRTAPLWGLRTKPRFLHDGSESDIESAIARHKHDAKPAAKAFRHLNATDRANLLAFLHSL